MSKTAKILADQQSPLIECTVCNLTSDGARLDFPTTMPAARSFTLSFDNFRSRRSCRVVWRTIDKLGVSFY